MGYGLDTEQYDDRKWGTTITWSGELKGKLAEALAAWQNAAGVTFSQTTSNPGFKVKWVGTGTSESHAGWHNFSPGNGKPAVGRVGSLDLKEDHTLGSMIHEIGHLLGLSHEHDHPDKRESFYESDETGWGLRGAERRAAKNRVYGEYDDDSIMRYPKSHYQSMTSPSAGDVDTVKQINGWD